MIREARADDVPDLLRLIRGLAEYEREPDAVVATEESLTKALFGPGAIVHALVAEADGRVVGMALWFLAFSTWTGRHSLYLEDLFVEPEQRGGGLGRALMETLAGRAVEQGCARMDWSVLDWNEPSIGFYRSLGATPLDGWTTWRLEGPALDALNPMGRRSDG
ncbi:MAG TPA: GNAT family N-acetyltransferase [Acidimicrobiales bacterium]|nr:GNAT family N-acetyltransferase [Acidimicrobiales bacterium]